MEDLKILSKEQVAGLSDAQKALVKLRVINDKLQLNDKIGEQYVIEFLFNANYEAIAAQAVADVAAIKAEQAKSECVNA